MAGSNGSGGTAQARRHAARAKEKADARRDKASGAAGWVADRAGGWSLDDQDLGWMERQKYLWNPLMDYWFRMEIEGWENIPGYPDGIQQKILTGALDEDHKQGSRTRLLRQLITESLLIAIAGACAR